jgi:phosphatidylserine/phosphatidylglycerophosphate/cardiolipin synthase-like enzyme
MKTWSFLISTLFVTSAFANVSAYFNHNPSASYTDPYRNISRPGDNLEEVLLKEIKAAKKSIFVAVLEFRLPLVAAALAEKKAQGVDVRVILDNDYNFNIQTQRDSSEGEFEASKLNELKAFIDINKDGKIQKSEMETRDAVYMLAQAKIPVMDDSFDGSSGSGLMHHKFVIVDGKRTVVSTANFTMSCMHGDMLAPGSRGNANSMIVVESTNFAKIFTEEFAQLWGNGKRGNYGHNKTYRGPVTTSVGGTKITVQFSPTSQRYQWEESTNGLIASHLKKATQSVKGLFFVFSDQKLSDVLEKRSISGAEIGVIIEPKFAFRDYSEALDMLGLEMKTQKCTFEADNNPWKFPIKEVGMARLAKGDVLHHKFAVVDNKTVIMGSQNWSDAANYINDETLIVIQSPAISEQYTKEYNRVKKSATLGAPDWVKTQIKQQEQNCADQGHY